MPDEYALPEFLRRYLAVVKCGGCINDIEIIKLQHRLQVVFGRQLKGKFLHNKS
jgi:hypothetical protein